MPSREDTAADAELAQPLDVAPASAGDGAGTLHAAPVPSVDLRGVLLAAFGAIAFSGKAIIVKLAYRFDVDAVTLLALRMAVALPLFLAMAVWAARRSAPLERGDGGRIVLLGFLGYYLASFLDFAGLAYITATLERLILYLNPTLVLLLGVCFLGQKASPAQWWALAVSYAGVALAVGHDLDVGGRNIMLGSILVFGSALAYAFYLLGSGALVQRVGAVRLTAYASTVACVLCIGQFLLLRPLGSLRLAPEVYGLSLVNGTLCTVLPVLMVMMAVARIGSARAAQIGMLGPVSTIVLSVFLLGEPMGPWQVAGTVLVLAGVFMVGRRA
ncbi:DMT family transporter [Lysobacter sp. SG-8]|uniref:DMT family transporter n=1 Tax=Marilutibacter penaei TaxID=2759900 RepID=A0A7W3U5Y5_9GAMM|nr:DMT family transporter [Lysobacter penaei]MBB1089546.1 DMT family transporter [Lysobacter penaei]